MQFMVTARDGDDPGALARRMAARPAHLELADRMMADGRNLFGVALLDDAGAMIGSTLIVDFPSRVELDGWLAVEPYVTGDVWRSVEVQPVQVGPSFARLRT